MGEAGLIHGETSAGESLLPVPLHLPKFTDVLSPHTWGEVCPCHQWCLFIEVNLYLCRQWRQGELLGVDLWVKAQG